MAKVSGTDFDDYVSVTASFYIRNSLLVPLAKSTHANDQIYGKRGSDTLWAGGGNDLVDAGDGDDQLYGEAGNDTLIGGLGSDRMYGGEGHDSLTGGAGVDTIDGGDGVDTASYAYTTAPLEADLRSGKVTVGGAGEVDTLVSIENLIGGANNDQLRGDDAANLIEGNAGNDVIAGEGGDDTLKGGGGTDKINGGAGDDLIYGDDGSESFPGVTDIGLYGDDGHDTVFGGNGDDRIDGGTGDDVLTGNLGNDTLVGGPGVDTASYSYARDPVVADLGTGTARVGTRGTDTDQLTRDPADVTNRIENLVGGAAADVLKGDEGANSIDGGAGNDRIDAGAGEDTANGGAGNDSIFGAEGNDTLTGGAGDDTIDGGDGVDTAVYGKALTASMFTSREGIGWAVDARSAAQGTDLLSSIDILDAGPAGHILLVGNGGYATIQSAIDAAADGDLILVAAGVYAEVATYRGPGQNNLGLLIDKSVTLVGMGPGGRPATDPADLAVIVESSAESSWGTNFMVTAPDVRISGIEFRTAYVGEDLGYVANKAFEVIADGFWLTHCVVRAADDNELGSSVYFIDEGAPYPNSTSVIRNYRIEHNVLHADITVSQGTGLGADVGDAMVIKDNTFRYTDLFADPDGYPEAWGWGIGLRGFDDDGEFAGYRKAPIARPTEVSGNVFEAGDYPWARYLSSLEEDPDRQALTLDFMEAYVADNAFPSYAYVTLPDGSDLRYQDFIPFDDPTLQTDDLYAELSGTLAAALLFAEEGDRLIVFSGRSPVYEFITVDNLTLQVHAGSVDLDVALDTGVLRLTLADDPTTGRAAAVDVEGNDGPNTLIGNSAANHLIGIEGPDALLGGAGHDTLTGGADADTLTGGTGSDTFVFTTRTDSTADAYDRINDFVSGADKLKTGVTSGATSLRQGAAYTSAGGGDLTADIEAAVLAGNAAGGVVPAVNAAYLVTIASGSNQGRYVFQDADGDGEVDVDELVIELTGTSSVTLSPTDFVA